MNHIYRIIFNRSTGIFQAVCELAKNTSSGRSKTRGKTALLSSDQGIVIPSKLLSTGLSISLVAAFAALPSVTYAAGAILKTDSSAVLGTITVDSGMDEVGIVATGAGVGVTSVAGNHIVITGQPDIETQGGNGHGISAAITSGATGTGNITITTNTGGQIKTSGTNAHGINATSNAGSAGHGHIVVNSNAAITATGSDADGISVQASGGGNVTIANTAAINSVKNGIYTLANGGDTTITNSGAITTGNMGIYATKVNTAGNTSITNSGAISGVKGIFVENTVGNVEINNTGDINATGLNTNDWGIAVHHDSAKSGSTNQTIAINHSGKIVTNGTDASSIRAYTGAASGSVTINLTNPELISNGATGVKGGTLNESSTMDYTVKTTGGSITAKGDAIVATGIRSGKLVIDNNGTALTSTNGSFIFGETSGSGNVYITSQDATLTSNTGRGILARARDTSSGNLYIGYDGNGNAKPITGTLTNQENEVIIAWHRNNGDININVGNATIESQSTTGGFGRGIMAYRPSTTSSNNPSSATAIGGDTHITVGQATINTFNSSMAEGILAAYDNANLAGKKIVIDSQATITTKGSTSSGVRAYNYGSGDISITQQGNITTAGSSSSGIQASVTKGGNVFVGYDEAGNAKAITGVITTGGASSAGILVTNSAAGATTKVLSNAQIDTTGSSGYGIHVNSLAIDINNTGAISTKGATAHGVSALNNAASADAIKVVNSGNISVAGMRASGIYVNQNSSNATGTVRLTNRGDITASGNIITGGSPYVQGIYARSAATTADLEVFNSGNITVSGAVTSDANFGIFAVGDRGGNITVTHQTGDITVSQDASNPMVSTAAREGIEVKSKDGTATLNLDSGNVKVDALTGGLGITAWSNNAGSTTSKSVIRVGQNGDVAAVTANGDGVWGAEASANTVDVLIGSKGSITGGTGVGARGIQSDNSTAMTLNNQGTVATTSDGIGLAVASQAAGGTVDITNSGVIKGGSGISITNATSGTLANGGTIAATDASGYAIDLAGSNIATTLKTGSVLQGDVYSSNTGNTLILQGTATEDSSFLSSGAANNFASLTVNTDGLTSTYWTLTGDETQIAAVNAVAITNGANNTTSTLTLAPASSADYAFNPQLSGDGTLAVNLGDSAKQFSFANTGNTFNGVLDMKNSTFLLDNAGEATLSNGTLKLSAGGMTELNQDRAINALTLNGGTLKVDFEPDTTAPKGTLTAAKLDATGGGAIAAHVPTAIDTSATPHANFLDYTLDPANSQIKVVNATGAVVGAGTQLALTDYAGNNIAANGFESTIEDGGDTLGTAKFGYVGSVKNDGVWLGFGLKELNANSGKNIHVDNNGATGDTLGAQLTGSGGFEFNSQPGTTINVGNATSNYTGETIVDGGGTVKLIANNALGQTDMLTVKTNSTLDMNATSLVLNGEFKGEGASTLQLNGGKLTLNNAQNATAGQLIADGTLIVGQSAAHGQARLTGDLDMPNGSLLGGHGQVAGLVTLKSGSTISPGTSIGTLTVGQIDFEAGSIYDFEAYQDGSADKIVVSSALGNGQATITGAILNVLGGAGTWQSDVTYTVLTADGGVSGTFDTVKKDTPFLTHEVQYNPNDVQLVFTRSDVKFPDVAEEHNQKGSGSGVESLGPKDPLYQQIVGMNAQQARNAFDNLSGEVHASLKSAMLTNSRYARNAVNQHLSGSGNMATTRIDDGKGLWVNTWGHDGHLKNDGNAARLDSKGYGVLAGVDAYSTEKATVGVALGYEQNNLKIGGTRNSKADVDAIHLLAYGRAQAGEIDIKGGIGYSRLSSDTTRHISVGSISSKNEASYNGGLVQLFVEGSHTFDVSDAYSVTPYAGLAYQRVKMDSFTEKGSAGQLHGNGDATNMTTSTVGVRGNWQLNTTSNVYADLGWQHNFGGSAPQTNLNFTGGERYNVKGVQTNRNAALIGLGANFQIKPNMSLSIGYEGLFGNRSTDHGAKVLWEVKF